MCGGLREKVGLAIGKEEATTCINYFFVKRIVASSLFLLQTVLWCGWHSCCKQGKACQMHIMKEEGSMKMQHSISYFYVLLFIIFCEFFFCFCYVFHHRNSRMEMV